MVKIFDASVSAFKTHLSLLILRLGMGALMLTHGWPKLMRLFSGEEITFPDPLGLGSTFSLVLATLAEVLGSLMVMSGLATRLAAFSLIFTMGVAVFIVHANDPFSYKELGLVYLIGFIALFITGAGKYSLDRLIR